MAFNFELLLTPWTHADLTLAIERSEALHPPETWPTYALSNHDQQRHATRYGRHRARIAAFLLLTLRGVAVLYAGEEIGMIDGDPRELPQPPIDRAGRDGCRTPMQWDASPRGGFTGGEPWLPPVDPTEANVADQRDDPASLLALYRELIAARRRWRALRHGQHRSIFGLAPGVLAWIRELEGERILVVSNVGDEPRRLNAHRLPAKSGEVIVATSARRGPIRLRNLNLEALE